MWTMVLFFVNGLPNYYYFTAVPDRQLSGGATPDVVGDARDKDVHEVTDGPPGDEQAIRDGRRRVRDGRKRCACPPRVNGVGTVGVSPQ